MNYFTKGPGLVLFSSDRPGQHAAMICPNGTSLMPMAHHNSFNDQAKKYTWGFLWFMPFADGQKFTFATVEYDVTGVVIGEEIKITDDRKIAREPPTMRPIRLAVEAPDLSPKAELEVTAKFPTETDPDTTIQVLEALKSETTKRSRKKPPKE